MHVSSLRKTVKEVKEERGKEEGKGKINEGEEESAEYSYVSEFAVNR